jgi:hypothetical protein
VRGVPPEHGQAAPQKPELGAVSRKRKPARQAAPAGRAPRWPFTDSALELHGYRLAVIPLGGDDGKTPLVEWRNWTKPPGRTAVASFAAKFAWANIGVLTGLSGVTVVDVDDPALVDPITVRCGTTPLITATPRGGVHLWYHAAGERSTDLRASEGIAVDVKAAGGLIVVPPSIAWAGSGKGRAYRFVAGSWGDLASLPQVYPGSLPTAERKGATVRSLRAVRHGVRNSTLLKTLLRQVRHCDTEADLLDVAITIVQQHFELQGVPPFTAAEIAHTVESVWKIDQEGRNWVGQEAHIMIRAHEFLVLQESPDALTLYMRLLWAHAAREEEPFAISPKAMARDESITGWTYPRRYIQARDWLLEQGFLAQEHVGGSKPGDANLYRLTTPPAKGDKSSPIGTADFASQASDSEKAEKGDYGYPYIRKHPAPSDRAPPPLVLRAV